MKKFILSIIILFATYSGYSQELDYVVKIKLKPQSDKNYVATEDAKMMQLASKHGVTMKQSWWLPSTNPELYLYYDLRVKGSTSKESKENFIKDFLATGKFEDEVYEYEIAYHTACPNPVTVNDPHTLNGVSHTWPLTMIEAGCAWSITTGSSSVLIGIADTDFRMTHEDLSSKFASVSGPTSAGFTHGTMVSSVAAAATNNGKGVASIGYNSKIAAHRIKHDIDPITGKVTASTSDIKTAIMNLHQSGVKIINVSWSGTGLSQQEAQTITQSGTTLVVSGGNDNLQYYHSPIANVAGVIVVSAVNILNQHGPTNFAHNQYIDLCAPGWDIMVAKNLSDNSYDLASGTSFAAPFVAGTVALIKNLNPALTPAQIEQIIKATTDPIADGGSYQGQLGTGRLNAYKAVSAAAMDITGPSSICYGSSYTFSASNFVAGCTWDKSSNLNLSGSGNTVSVSASSNSSGNGWVSINCGGVELVRYNITIYPILVFSSITGPIINSPSRDSTFLTFYANFTGAVPTIYNWTIIGIPSGSYSTYTNGNLIVIGVTQPWNFELHVTGYTYGVCNSSASGYINVNFSKGMMPRQNYIEDELEEEYLSIYPNPVVGVLNIEIHNINQKILVNPTFNFRIYDSFGSLKLQTSSQNSNSQINLGNLRNGIYFLHVYDESSRKIMTKKIIVNN